MNMTTTIRIILSLAAASAFSACGKGGAPGKTGVQPKPAVAVERIERGAFVRELALTGVVEPTVLARLSSPAEGPVVFAALRETDFELVPAEKRRMTTDEFIRELRPKVAALAVPGASLMVAQRKMRGIRTLGQSDIEIEINGADIDRLFSLAGQVSARLRERPELTNVYISLDYSKPEFQLVVNREKAADLGLTVDGIASALRGYVGGDVPTEFREANELYDVRVIIPERELRTRSDVENLVVALPAGGYVRLRDIAAVVPATGPVEIIRQNQVKQVVVRVDAKDTNLGGAQDAVDAAIAGFEWPAGYSWSVGSKAKQMEEMRGTVKAILGLALFFSFLVLAVQFNDLRLPLVVLAGVPFCLAGIGFGLFLTGQPFGATVVIAVLVVLAANVNDAVLLIETAGHNRRDGMPLLEATRKAAIVRLRPRLMTTIPIVLGFLPLALHLEEGGELLRPMAAAAIRGLILEVLVAILLVPALYTWLARRDKPDGATA